MELSYIIAKLIQFMQIPQIHKSVIAKESKVRYGCLVVDSSIDKYSYIAERTTIICAEIGRFTSISYDCYIGGASHPIRWVSTSPVFQGCSSVLKKKFAKIKYDPYQKTYIGNDVWIGTGCLIKAGISIGNGAIIGMGSVLTKDVKPYEIWAGNPAKKIGDRFDDEKKKKLCESEWWNWPEEEIHKRAINITDVDDFLRSKV